MKLIQPERGEPIAQARRLFEEHAASLGFELCFQGFDRELAGLPGEYASPEGRLLLAIEGDEAAGCAALRKMSDGACGSTPSIR